MTQDEALKKPLAWLTEERYAEIHTSKWTPKIQQVFSKDGLLESQTIQYAPQSAPTPYPPKCPWISLTEGEIIDADLYTMRTRGDSYAFARAIEAKLKEKNGVSVN